VRGTFFIVGHGGHKESKGNITVPEKCEVRFYVTHGCKMDSARIHDMLQRATIKCHDGVDPLSYRARSSRRRSQLPRRSRRLPTRTTRSAMSNQESGDGRMTGPANTLLTDGHALNVTAGCAGGSTRLNYRGAGEPLS
jgi:hypothetical protein